MPKFQRFLMTNLAQAIKRKHHVHAHARKSCTKNKMQRNWNQEIGLAKDSIDISIRCSGYIY